MYDFSIRRNHRHLAGNPFAAGFQSFLCGKFQAAAAGHLHAGDGKALDIVFPDDGGKLFSVIAFVQFGTADQSNPVSHKAFMKIPAGVGGTVGSQQQVCSLKKKER